MTAKFKNPATHVPRHPLLALYLELFHFIFVPQSMIKALKHFFFRRDEPDPVRALNLCQGGVSPEPDLCVLWACHQREAHSLVRFHYFE